MSEKRRLGIFGGTFNPPHIGHVESAKSFIKALSLDKLLIIPTFIPPHKISDDMATPENRLEMCRLAFSGIPKCEVSDIEIKRGGKSYTYLTLESLSAPDTHLFLLCGTDMILTMDSWANPEVIFKLATICYARRENDELNNTSINEKIVIYRQKYGAEIVFLNTPVIEISSSEIRRKLRSGEPYQEFLSTQVEKHIIDSELYK